MCERGGEAHSVGPVSSAFVRAKLSGFLRRETHRRSASLQPALSMWPPHTAARRGWRRVMGRNLPVAKGSGVWSWQGGREGDNGEKSEKEHLGRSRILRALLHTYPDKPTCQWMYFCWGYLHTLSGPALESAEVTASYGAKRAVYLTISSSRISEVDM